MTQRYDLTRHPFRISRQRSLLVRGLGWVGGMGILSSGMVLAQTTPSAEVAVPSAQDLLLPSTQELPIPEAPRRSPTVTPAIAPPPQGFTPEVSASRSPQPSVSIDSSMAAPTVIPSSPAAPSQAVPPDQAAGNGAYIDPTDYSLGATPHQGRPSVVLSERSTGCQTVLQQGQTVPASICGVSRAALQRLTSQPPSENVNSIRMGPISLSTHGIGIARNAYNLSARPVGLPGNGNLNLMFPLSIPVAITSAFGWRIHPISGDRRFHYGTDLGAALGTPVLAAYTGRVAIADFMQGYGLTVVLQHDEATKETLYGHLSEIFVRPGDWIEQGAVIGRVGSTGNSTGPHLHFEFREHTRDGWVAMDPGGMLQKALTQFVQGFQVAQTHLQPQQADPLAGLLSFVDFEGFKELSKVSKPEKIISLPPVDLATDRPSGY